MMESVSYLARRGKVELRILAYKPKLEPVPEGCLRVVVQSIDQGEPIAEDPLHVEAMTPNALAQALYISQTEGWEIAGCFPIISTARTTETNDDAA